MYYVHYNQQPCPPGTAPYIVQAGDTFYRLAIRFNTTVQAIAAANPTVNPNMLMIGQQICIPRTTPPPTTCPEGTIPYTIRAGDTFYAIARANNISLDALIAANPGVNPDRLFIGQIICIPRTTPPPTTCPEGTRSYTIKAGDTFYAIARANNISLDALLAANPGVDPDRLFIGQTICIPETTPPPTPVCPTLRLGSRGASVEELQRLLRDAGYDPGPIDGIFGSRTQAAVREFQRDEHIVVDGVVGIRTWTALGVNCATPAPPPTCPEGTRSYTIRSGDTLYTLAIRFNTTVEAIRRLNPSIDPNSLRVGQIICIPRS